MSTHDIDETAVGKSGGDATIKEVNSTTPTLDVVHDTSDLFLDRLRRNAKVYPRKRAMVFITSSSSSTTTNTALPSTVTIQHELSYAELESETDRLARSLLEDHKLQKGDRAVLVYPPSLHFTIAFIACLKANIVAVPVFPPNPVRRDSLQMFAVIVEACDAKIALTNTNYQHTKKLVGIRDALQKWSLSRQKRTSAKNNSPKWPDSLTWIVTDDVKDVTTKKKPLDLSMQRETNDELYRKQIAFLQFTSGSTSDPKGVMITHGNLAHNISCITNELQAIDDTVVVSWLPQYHDMGLIGSVLGCIYCGGTGFYMSPLTFLQRPSIWIEAISIYKATHLQAPNFAYKLTARKFLESKKEGIRNNLTLDLSSVRHAINAAEPVDVESIQVFYQTFKPFGLKEIIYPTYGLAEHTVFVCSGGKQVVCVDKEELEIHRRVVITDGTSLAEKERASSILVGCGYPSSQGIDVKIVHYANSDDTSSEVQNIALGEDMVGEIWIRSPSKALGYYGKPKETEEDFHALLFTTGGDVENGERDGYLRTGDLGFYHNTELFICGRLKDLIIVGGRNYYPQDIESTAESTSDLVRLGCSAAFTIDPTNQGGEEVALVMELKEIPASKEVTVVCDPLASQVRSLINQDHSIGISSISFLKPRTVPKTSSGKIARSWCRKAYVARTLDIVYQKIFTTEATSPREEDRNKAEPSQQQHPSNETKSNDNPISIRAKSKDEILKMLLTDIARVGNVDPSSIDKKTSLIHILDSLSITQFKGLLENNYAVKLSDEYLFREKTTVMKLVEVVKLGYAPDDGDGVNVQSNSTTPMPGQAKGLAGALGCPPGVVCVIM